VPEGSEITQVPATILALHGLEAPLDEPAIDAILDRARIPASRPAGTVSQAPVERPVYTREEEARMVERLRDLGYE
jgi:hypothetical protein